MSAQNEHLVYDWFHRALPSNISLGPNVYIESSYIFAAFFSTQQPGLMMGQGSGAYDLSSIATGPNALIKIGAYTCLNSTSLIADVKLTIGSHCLFAWGSVVTDTTVPSITDLNKRRETLSNMARDPLRALRPVTTPKPVHIDDNVWVGFDSVIMGGVNIGRGAIIGCKTVITEDVPPYAIVVGNPCRVVRFLEPDDGDMARTSALREFGIEISDLDHTRTSFVSSIPLVED